MRRGGLLRVYTPLLGYVYVIVGGLASILAEDHRRAAFALFSLAGFTFLWWLGSLHARMIRYDPDGFFGMIVVLGGAAFLALQPVALASTSTLIAGPAAACAATVVIASSLAALSARKVGRRFGSLGVAGGVAVLVTGVVESAADWTLSGQTVWLSVIGFMIWVVVTSTYLIVHR